MENFILYDELGEGNGSVVYKGRRKGTLSYVAIICSDKAKRPEVTNHVRLIHDLSHQNIVSFYEWYETSSHLWLVVELCTGGSLEAVIGLDGCLSEEVVRGFGCDLVRGLNHIHKSGIIFSDLTPAKILLDGNGNLKLSNFRLSKAEGETLEELFALLSTSEDGGEGSEITGSKSVQGCLSYCAPEVLQGADTSGSSDLWALGCVLYYMYTGKPPFHSESCSELTNMILHEEPPPLRQIVSSFSPPSEEFQSLIKGLLIKDPDKRMNWPEVMAHPFWTHLLNVEEDEEGDCDEEGGYSVDSRNTHRSSDSRPDKQAGRQAGHGAFRISADSMASTTVTLTDRLNDRHPAERHSSLGAFKNSQGSEGWPGEGIGAERDGEWEETPPQTGLTPYPNKSFTCDSVSELRPKSGVDKDHNEAMFLLSSHTVQMRSCSIPDAHSQLTAPQVPAAQAGHTNVGCSNVSTSVKALLYTDSDLTVTPIIDNPKILKSPSIRFDPKTLCVPAYSAEKLLSLSDKEWGVILLQLCSCLDGQTSSTAPRPALRSKLNLLCYLCCVVGHRDIATRLLNSALLTVLTQQLRQVTNWDVRSKVLRVMGLLALHCAELKEDSPVSEAVTALTDLLRDNLCNGKAKQFLLPPLGELLYLIASQEEKRGSPEALWFIPAAAYIGLMRSLREGDDTAIQHMAAKAIENLSTTVTGPSHNLVTTEIGNALWYLFTHSTVEAVRVTAISALSRLTRAAPALFLAVMDICGPVAILESVGAAGVRVLQHLLTAMAAALLSAGAHTRRLAQDRDLVLKVLRVLESPSPVTRAKSLLLLLLLIQENTHTLLFCSQNRLIMYLERDLRKTTSLRENASQSEYLTQCLHLLIVYLTRTAPLIIEEVLSALGGVVGRRNPSTFQSKHLKQTLPTMSVVLDLLSSQVFRSQIVTEEFLVQIGKVLSCISSVESKETNIASAVGAAVCEELIRTTLSLVEVLSQHPALITTHHATVVTAIMPPLMSLAFSRNVEWCVCVLRVLSELGLLLLAQEDHRVDEEVEEEEAMRQGAEDAGEEWREIAGRRRGNGRTSAEASSSSKQLLALISTTLLPRYDSFLLEIQPVPLYALKLLLSMTEHNTELCRLIKRSSLLPVLFQLLTANSGDVTSALVQNAVKLLCNLSRGPQWDLEPLYQQGLIEVVVKIFSEAAQHHVEDEERPGRKPSLVFLLDLLELLQNILKHTSSVVRSALQSQRLPCETEAEAAEKLLLANSPLSQLTTHIIQMLSTEDQDMLEWAIHCLSLLVQLYSGQGHDNLSPSCLRSLSHVLGSDTLKPSLQYTMLRAINRLVQTAHTSNWLAFPEGVELLSVLQDLSHSNRCQDIVTTAYKILQRISTL